MLQTFYWILIITFSTIKHVLMLFKPLLPWQFVSLFLVSDLALCKVILVISFANLAKLENLQ